MQAIMVRLGGLDGGPSGWFEHAQRHDVDVNINNFVVKLNIHINITYKICIDCEKNSTRMVRIARIDTDEIKFLKICVNLFYPSDPCAIAYYSLLPLRSLNR